MIRRLEALSLGNVFTKKSADGLSMADLKALIAAGDDRVINKLVHFGSGIQGTHQYLSHMSDQALAYLRFVRITSHDTEMLTFFQTFSAADLHWPDLHWLLPGSESYMGKRVVKPDIFNSFSAEEQQRCILSTDDHVQRSAAVNDNGNLVDLYFHHRLHKLLDIIGAAMKIEDYIIRYEAQARGTIHAHLLLRIKGGPSNRDLLNAKLAEESNVPESKQAEIASAKEKAIKFACSQMGVSGVYPNPDPLHWPGPHGQDVHTPAPENNILRQDYTTLDQD
jgi:hypothetical protein